MGNRNCPFSAEELAEYEELTYFTKSEILRAHEKFKKLAPEKVGHNKNAKLSMTKLLHYPELAVHPFGDRLCQIFSSTKDGCCSFDDFVDMLSVFSLRSPKLLKYEYIFRIYDFDDDDALNESDIRQVLSRLVAPNEFTEPELQQLVKHVFNEADLDNDEAISFLEFECILTKFPDFLSYSCGYHKLFLDVSNIIQNQFPEIQINGQYHDPPLIYYLLCKFITVAKFGLILILLTNMPIFRNLGMAEPQWYRSIVDNKLYSVFMIYFLSNVIESQLMSTGAFEIFLDDIPIWSKLETGHIPSPQELIKIIKNNLQFYKTDFKIE